MATFGIEEQDWDAWWLNFGAKNEKPIEAADKTKAVVKQSFNGSPNNVVDSNVTAGRTPWYAPVILEQQEEQPADKIPIVNKNSTCGKNDGLVGFPGHLMEQHLENEVLQKVTVEHADEDLIFISSAAHTMQICRLPHSQLGSYLCFLC